MNVRVHQINSNWYHQMIIITSYTQLRTLNRLCKCDERYNAEKNFFVFGRKWIEINFFEEKQIKKTKHIICSTALDSQSIFLVQKPSNLSSSGDVHAKHLLGILCATPPNWNSNEIVFEKRQIYFDSKNICFMSWNRSKFFRIIIQNSLKRINWKRSIVPFRTANSPK